MDERWFKTKQREAGVTAGDIAERLGRDRSAVSRIYVGRQQMTFDQAKIFADALNVELDDVLQKAGLTHESDAVVRRPPGFSESDVEFVGAPKPGEMQRHASFIEAFGGNRPGIDVWRVKSRSMSLGGFLEGDFMLVNTHESERTKAGDIVIAQIYDQSRGTASTVLRRHEPPVLVASSCDPADQRTYVVDQNNVAIRGRVIASWRSSKE